MQAVEAGRIGEHIAALRLLKLGVPCEIVNLETTDIIAIYEDVFLRVQVKSSSLKRDGRYRTPGYQWSCCVGSKRKTPLTRTHCDILAFVALDIERVWFMPVDILRGNYTKRCPPSKFTNDNIEIDSWYKSLKYIYS